MTTITEGRRPSRSGVQGHRPVPIREAPDRPEAPFLRRPSLTHGEARPVAMPSITQGAQEALARLTAVRRLRRDRDRAPAAGEVRGQGRERRPRATRTMGTPSAGMLVPAAPRLLAIRAPTPAAPSSPAGPVRVRVGPWRPPPPQQGGSR